MRYFLFSVILHIIILVFALETMKDKLEFKQVGNPKISFTMIGASQKINGSSQDLVLKKQTQQKKMKKKRYFANAGTNLTDNLVLQFNYSGENSDLYFVDTYKKTNYFGAGLNYRINEKQSLSLKYSYFNESGNYVYNLSKYNLENSGKDYKPNYTRVIVGYDNVNKKYLYTKKRRYNQSDRQSQGLKLSHMYKMTDNIEVRTDLFE